MLAFYALWTVSYYTRVNAREQGDISATGIKDKTNCVGVMLHSRLTTAGLSPTHISFLTFKFLFCYDEQLYHKGFTSPRNYTIGVNNLSALFGNWNDTE